jgi:hypothetical protein
MRGTLLTTCLVLMAVTAAAQSSPRFALGPVARVDRLWLDGHTTGTTPVAGVSASVRLSTVMAVEGEMTGATHDIRGRHGGRSFDYEPGTGVAGMIVVRPVTRTRLGVAARIGGSARRYLERSSYRVPAGPDGVDPGRVVDDAIETKRGGLLAGVDLEIALTRGFTLAPQLQVVYSGPAGVGRQHREVNLGLTGRWLF